MKYLRLKNINFLTDKHLVEKQILNPQTNELHLHLLADFLRPVVDVVGWVYDESRDNIIIAYRENTDTLLRARNEFIILEWIDFFEKTKNSLEPTGYFEPTLLKSEDKFMNRFNSFMSAQGLCYQTLDDLKDDLSIPEDEEDIDPDTVLESINEYNQDALPYDESEEDWFDCFERKNAIEIGLKGFVSRFYHEDFHLLPDELIDRIRKPLMLANGVLWFSKREIYNLVNKYDNLLDR